MQSALLTQTFGMNFSIYNFLRNLVISLRWVPSHCDTDNAKFLKYRPTIESVIYNCIADKVAEHAAKQVELPLHITKPVLYYTKLVQQVQRRLIYITTTFPHRAKHKGSPPSSLPPSSPISRHF